jgi:pimeloyl-ACP methyl ester carboxylesterase
MSGDVRFFRFDTGQVSLNVAEMGDRSKPLVICLHGFPEYWAAWEDVMRALGADFHVVAPDQRGFNLSDRPQGVEAYRSKHIVADLAALANHLSPDRPFVLAGHDWGASIAYAYAFAHPQRLSHLVIANGVHPALFQRAISGNPEQRRASQYMNRLRAEGAEARMAEDDYRRTFNMLSGFSKTDWMTGDERARYMEAWSRPGAMTGMLNWYRASPITVPAEGEPAAHSPIDDIPDTAMRVRVPHLLLWGEADEALRPVTTDGLADFAPNLTIRRFANSGHWLLHEQPQAVANAIRGFVG